MNSAIGVGCAAADPQEAAIRRNMFEHRRAAGLPRVASSTRINYACAAEVGLFGTGVTRVADFVRATEQELGESTA